jgi:hypothetical protein
VLIQDQHQPITTKAGSRRLLSCCYFYFFVAFFFAFFFAAIRPFEVSRPDAGLLRTTIAYRPDSYRTSMPGLHSILSEKYWQQLDV